MSTTEDPKAIANYFIELANGEGKPLTPLQIIKLVYIAHGWHLALTGVPLINEPPEAWQYGPVIPSLYHALKTYGNAPVTGKISDDRIQPGMRFQFVTQEIPTPADERIRAFLDSVWKGYKRFSGSQLSTMTHQPGTPWHKTWEEQGAKYSKGVDIPEPLIREHYLELNDRYGKAAGK